MADQLRVDADTAFNTSHVVSNDAEELRHCDVVVTQERSMHLPMQGRASAHLARRRQA
jgi:hypothetical protein